MARIDTLANFLTDVAAAIKNKTGKTETITPANFDTEINSIEVGGGSAGKYAPRVISFYNYTGTELDNELSNLDITDITSFANLFRGCSNLTSVANYTSMWDTSNVTDMSYMFASCNSMNDVNIANFNTANVTTMNSMFMYLPITSIDLSNFNTSNVTSMSSMFYSCSNLTEIDLSGFDTANCKSMSNMFYGCTSLESLDLSEFTTNSSWDQKLNLSNMFYNCTNLKHLDIRKFVLNSSVITYSNIFAGIPADCEIIVQSDAQRDYALVWRSDLTNIKTVAEYEGG